MAVSKVLRKITGYDPDKYDDRHKTDAQIRREMQSSTRNRFQVVKIVTLP